MSQEYVSTAEVAKLMRAELKRVWPQQRFYVWTSVYAGGSSIDVNWVDGPTTRQVDKVVGVYESTGFDGMIDLKYYINHYRLPGGKIVTASLGTERSGGTVSAWGYPLPEGAVELRFSTGFVFLNRYYSTFQLQAFVNRTAVELGHPAPKVYESSWREGTAEISRRSFGPDQQWLEREYDRRLKDTVLPCNKTHRLKRG